jgi:manganese efflux pump family protein
MVALVLVALSLGLSNFAAAVGIGVSGVSARARLEVGVVFGLFEAGMPLLGLALGHQLAHNLGHETRWVGGGLLVAIGAYGLLAGLRGRRRPAIPTTGRRTRRLALTGLALSVDNLAVGLVLGAYQVPVVIAAIVIGAVSVALSLVGLELGARIGARSGDWGEIIGSLILIVVGVAIAGGMF